MQEYTVTVKVWARDSEAAKAEAGELLLTEPDDEQINVERDA